MKTGAQEPYSSLTEFLKKNDFNGQEGLLHEIEGQCNREHINLTFDLIEEEGFSLNTLLHTKGGFSGNELENYLYQLELNPSGNELGKAIAKAIQKILQDAIGKKLDTIADNKTKTEAKKAFADLDRKSLSTFLNDLKYFLDERKGQVKNLQLDNLFISNRDIVDYLTSTSVIQVADYSGNSL
ncbi:MAG: hypothetical protein LBU27_04480 [Candidatus Peribacteria bacterium]|jgi:hypothetical protein|nr:hypothetical protein [Candidatus Peribacteria bacterium]